MRLLLLARSLTQNFVWWLVGAGVVGVLLPTPAGALRPQTPWILAVMIGGLGLSLPLGDLAGALGRWRLVSRGLGAQLLSTPALAFVLWRVGDRSAAAAGVAVQAAAPAEITSPLLAHLAGGALAGSLSVMSVSVVLAPVTMPVILRVVLGEAVPVPVVSILLSLLLTVALPLVVGSALHTLAGAKESLERLGPALSAAMVVLLVFAVAGGGRQAGLPSLAEVALLGLFAFLLMAVGFGAGWLAGFRTDRGDRLTLVFTTGMREFGIATAVALSFFGTEAALFPALYGVLVMVGSAWLAGRLRPSPAP